MESTNGTKLMEICCLWFVWNCWKLTMKKTILYICLAWLFFLTHSVHGLSWLSVAQLSSISDFDRDSCSSLKSLTKRQTKICKRNVEHMESVYMGARMAIHECQYQFRNRPWNCTVFPDETVFGKVLKLGTRETAFVHAISAAGVAYSVTRACSTGKLERCGCDRSYQGVAPSGTFQWAGCSENVHYGSAFSRSFVDVAERRKKQTLARMLMNLHNNEAGRKTIENHIRLQCKCHGVSGSCELRTCWRVMPTFRQVGQLLKDKFDGATETSLSAIAAQQRKGLVPVNPSFKPHTVDDLVYLTPSPNYCTRDNMTDTHGTHGRLCNATSKAIDGCELLCCGRGYVTRKERRTERCQCKFHWCCQVKCKECEVFADVSTCL